MIEQIFAHPPVSQAELERRLGAVDARRARTLLVARLRGGQVADSDASLFASVFQHLGVGEAYDELLDLARDSSRDSHVRAKAIGILAEDGPGELDSLMESLPPEEVTPLAEISLREMLASIQADPDQADTVAYVLDSSPPDSHSFLLEQIERCRKQAGTPAAAAYSHVLADERFGHMRDCFIKAVVQEGGAQGLALLERLRDAAVDPKVHRACQGAVLRLRTRAIDPGTAREQPEGEAYVGSCDGQGAYILIGSFTNPDGSRTLADLCIRCAADVRDGFVIPRGTAADEQELLEEIRSGLGISFVAIPLRDAAQMVSQAVARTTAADLTVPDDALPAVAMFERALDLHPPRAAAADPGQLATPSSTRRVTIKRVRQLFEAAEYHLSWFFDLGDLDAVGVELPGRSRAKAAWYRDAASRLATDAIQRRVLAMVRHMQRWHGWRGEAAEVELCGALAAATERDFTTSPLVRVMLEHSLDAGEEPGMDGMGSYGDAVLRQHLKALFFQKVSVPRGRDLARLDLTEAALVSLDAIFDSLPGESRPREDERYSTAFALGKTFADFMLSGQDKPVEYLARRMTSAIRKSSRLDWDQRHQVVAMILPLLGSFLEEVCGQCPVSCLERPKSKVEDIFFSPTHPMEPRQAE